VAGQVTSAAWGATTGACVGLAYLREATTPRNPGLGARRQLLGHVGGDVHPITVSLKAIYDPANERIR